jgi:predicted DNA-binding protein (MmcQ/YjbR family)
MNIIEFREYCLSFNGASEGLPFGNDTFVFKVKGKIFCLTGIDDFEFINLKCDPDHAIVLREKYPAVTPGYHMNKTHWNSIIMDSPVPDTLVQEWIEDSYKLVVAGLPKKNQEELGNEEL